MQTVVDLCVPMCPMQMYVPPGIKDAAVKQTTLQLRVCSASETEDCIMSMEFGLSLHMHSCIE